MLVGADLSAWQGPLGPNDLDFVVVKFTQGAGFRDPMAAVHAQNAINQGKILLAYHFGENGEGEGGARNFLAAIAPFADHIARLEYDCEYQNDANPNVPHFGPTVADLYAWHRVVAAAYPNKPRDTYTASYYYGSVLGDPAPPAGSGLWWAHLVGGYQQTDPHALAAQVTKPPLPDLPWPDYVIRQVGFATVGGVGPVDINVTFLSREQLAGTSGPTPTPPQPEDDMTPAQEAKLDGLAKAIFVTYVKLDAVDKRLDAEGQILEYGDANRDGKPDHVGLAQITAQLSSLAAEVSELKSLLTPKAAS